jgi:DNA-binding MarR family transcriptional regulator
MTTQSALGELELELTRLLRRARSAQARTAAEVHPELDSSGYALLISVRDLAEGGGAARGSDLSDVLGLHKSTMSRNLATLEALGLIERIIDPEDSRARQVRLTAQGQAALDRTFEGRRERLRERLDSWEPDDIAELARLLRRLNDAPLS